KASVGVLGFLGVAVVLISLLSANLAYRGEYQIGGVDLAQVAQGRDNVLTALRGIRGTSAAFGAAYGILLLSIVFGPYRRGERWAWWALCAAFVALAALVAIRVPLTGERLGVGAALTHAGVGIFGLLLDVGRLRSNA
ncbi:MAG TPA: hypothetical protein VFM29_08870, partial [Vicinamibacteria bacterium]|nr:hypothetical protein [Vicinamibacteria bacterium]